MAIKENPHTLVLADFLFPEYLGGSARFATEINYCLSLSTPIECITREPSGHYSSKLKKEHTPSPIYINKKTILTIMRKIIFTQYNAVISHHYCLGLLSLFSRRAKRIYFFHGPVASESKAKGCSLLSQYIKKKLEYLVLSQSHTIYCLSPYMERFIPKKFKHKVHITGPLHCIAPPSTLPLKKTSPQCPLKLLAVRRLTPRTGVLELVEKIANLEHLHLTIIGKGELTDKITSYNAKNVTLLQEVSEEQLNAAYRNADLTLLPSKELEGFGLVITESLLRGTPVLASTQAGGGTDFLKSISSAFIFDPNISCDAFLNAAIEAINCYNQPHIRENILKQFRLYSMPYFVKNTLLHAITHGFPKEKKQSQ